MSAVQHEQAAAAHQGEAGRHTVAYDPAAKDNEKPCDDSSGPCWTSDPTAEHKVDAEKHRKMAADHRAGAQALRNAEARDCVHVAADDRDISPFNHRADVTGVRPDLQLPLTGYALNGDQNQLRGAVVTVRAVPGLTQEWLQRIVTCHLARNNALGNNVPEMTYCPLVLKGITARVTSAGDSFAVSIDSQDAETAKEILRRARALLPAG